MTDLLKPDHYVAYEPKRKNRWMITIHTSSTDKSKIKTFAFYEASRPLFKKDKCWKFWKGFTPQNSTLVMTDPVQPSTSQIIYDFMINKTKLDYDLELLGPVGDVVEKWEVRGCEILEVDFGELSYEKNKIATCSILIKPKTAKLVF